MQIVGERAEGRKSLERESEKTSARKVYVGEEVRDSNSEQ
jgi:hypothetical protein